MPLIHTPIHTPTAIGCHARYQPARQERLGLSVLLRDTWTRPGYVLFSYRLVNVCIAASQGTRDSNPVHVLYTVSTWTGFTCTPSENNLLSKTLNMSQCRTSDVQWISLVGAPFWFLQPGPLAATVCVGRLLKARDRSATPGERRD